MDELHIAGVLTFYDIAVSAFEVVSCRLGDGDWKAADLAGTVTLYRRKIKLKMWAFVLINLFYPCCAFAVDLFLEDLPLPALASAWRV